MILQIGDFQCNYLPYETNAPKAYDGFGTISLYDDLPKLRLVLIDERHKDWQVGRYLSGMHYANPFTEHPESIYRDILYKRMTTEQAA